MAGDFLASVGATVRAVRERRAWSRRELATASGVSERFLAQLESGDGNISLRRFADVCGALGTTPAALLADAAAPIARPIALLGVRGAGKSTVGAALARRLGVAFVELDQRIEAAAGLPLGEVFAVHGEAYYRRVEREVLTRLLDRPDDIGAAKGRGSAASDDSKGARGPTASDDSKGARGPTASGDSKGGRGPTPTIVIAVGGGIVNDATNYAMLRARCRTVWLRARPEDHWQRVIAQGDQRPMRENPHAFAELRALFAARAELYAKADLEIDTHRLAIPEVVAKLATLAAAA